MTFLELVRVCVRRWYVVLLGVALTAFVGQLTLARPGVYWAQANLILLEPPELYYPNTIVRPPHPLAPLAGLLVLDWNGTHRPLLTSSSDTTIYGEGLRQGVQVRLPNQGSQFQPLFDAPVVEVQAVGATAQEVADDMTQAQARVETLLRDRQTAAGVPRAAQVTILTSPRTLDVQHVTGSRTRAALATALAGAGLTGVLTWLADRALLRLGRRWRASRAGRQRVAQTVTS